MTTWQSLFERAAEYDVDVEDVRDALSERRDE
ncbi:hypothetical protein HALDL1_15095 [Halobacterium sp. DL1]|jgi:hypothetical protein|nr:hypothetical protein HALDL1_15095 [Halobacterium sp. DL1]